MRHRDRGVLLTGDRRLRRVAEVEGMRVHGVLWVIDQLHKAGRVLRHTDDRGARMLAR